MANNRTTANTIRANINGQRKRATKAVCIYGIPAALVTTAFFPRGVLIWVIICSGSHLYSPGLAIITFFGSL
jgi:hypothetical protein